MTRRATLSAPVSFMLTLGDVNALALGTHASSDDDVITDLATLKKTDALVRHFALIDPLDLTIKALMVFADPFDLTWKKAILIFFYVFFDIYNHKHLIKTSMSDRSRRRFAPPSVLER